VRILLVEDDETLAQVIRRGLSGEGHVIDVARDGVDGLIAASENGYDVIILDIMLPRLSGYAVLKQLRGREVWAPVLMLTSKDGVHDQSDAFDLGADDYLTKPFSFVLLKARLRALQRRGNNPRPTTLVVGDLALDPATHAVSRGEVSIQLTPREFGLLEFLMRHPDEVVTKHRILENVWDTMYDGDPNIVEVYVGYLRRKIDLPFDCASIETVRGVGYRLSSGMAH
jgi:two-component system OmpR family response regulator